MGGKRRYCSMPPTRTPSVLVLQASRGESWAVIPFQLTVNIGTCVMYQGVASQSLQSICLATTGADTGSNSSSTDGTGSSGGRSGGGTAGCLRLTWWIFILSAAQLLFRLLPDTSVLASVTALGAATNLGFSALATVGAALHGMHAAAACWTALQLSVVDARLLKCHCALLLGGAA